MTSLGIEQFVNSPPKLLMGNRLGLLCNQASTDSKLHHSKVLIHKTFPGQLTCLFSPQHGFFAEKQDNMIETDDYTDPRHGIPVFSLYSDVRYPTNEMMETFDVLLVDLQDIGTRIYTYVTTLTHVLEACTEHAKSIWILSIRM